MKKEVLLQVLKYGLVGILNTFLTALTIWVILRFGYGVTDETRVSSTAMAIANVVGYAIGVVSSFLFNRNWTFKSKSDWKTGFLRFLLVFAVCYLLQLLVVVALNELQTMPSVGIFGYTVSSAYICQCVGIVVYTVTNFLLNKYYTFRVRAEI